MIGPGMTGHDHQPRLRVLSGHPALLEHVPDPTAERRAPTATELDCAPPRSDGTPQDAATTALRQRPVIRGIAAGVLVLTAVALMRAPAGTDDRTIRAAAEHTAAAQVSISTPQPEAAREEPDTVAPQVLSSEQVAALPVARVGADPGRAPADPAPGSLPGTTVLHPTRDTVVYAGPGAAAVAVLPKWQLLWPTWVPVVARRPGWAMVLLPTRPHPDGTAAVGWVHLQPTVQLSESQRRIEIDTATGKVTVLAELARTDTASPVTEAAAAASAPAVGRRSFVAVGGRVVYTPWLLKLVWPLTVDVQRLCSGPLGAVSIPGLAGTTTLGEPDESGCVPTAEKLRPALREVPAGTVVLLR